MLARGRKNAGGYVYILAHILPLDIDDRQFDNIASILEKEGISTLETYFYGHEEFKWSILTAFNKFSLRLRHAGIEAFTDEYNNTWRKVSSGASVRLDKRGFMLLSPGKNFEWREDNFEVELQSGEGETSKFDFFNTLLPVSIRHSADASKTPALVPEGARVLLSENLFRGDDGNDLELTEMRQALYSLLKREDSPIAIMSPRELHQKATNGNVSKENLAIVMTEKDYSDKSIWRESEEKDSLKASVLILGENLTGKKYICLEAIVGLADALMRNDVGAVKGYYKLLSGRELDAEKLAKLAVGDINNIEFAKAAILVFCDAIKEVGDKDFERYRLIMEDCFIAA